MCLNLLNLLPLFKLVNKKVYIDITTRYLKIATKLKIQTIINKINLIVD